MKSLNIILLITTAIIIISLVMSIMNFLDITINAKQNLSKNDKQLLTSSTAWLFMSLLSTISIITFCVIAYKN